MMTGNLYQLRSRFKHPPGTYFAIDGPHDTHGYVVKVLDEDTQPLHLVRGTGHGADGRRLAENPPRRKQ